MGLWNMLSPATLPIVLVPEQSSCTKSSTTVIADVLRRDGAADPSLGSHPGGLQVTDFTGGPSLT